MYPARERSCSNKTLPLSIPLSGAAPFAGWEELPVPRREAGARGQRCSRHCADGVSLIPCEISSIIKLIFVCVLFVLVTLHASAQAPIPLASADYPKTPEVIEKLGDNLFGAGTMRIDTAKREVIVPGKITNARMLEFIASTKSEFRTYESAIQLDANALTFNVAMILIGLDKAHSQPSRYHFDPNPPTGDLVEVFVDWKAGGVTKHVRAEELLWDEQKKERFPRSQWVYTGSLILPDGRYRADLDGVLIGFVHDPASIIEWVGSNGLGRFGYIKLDPQLGLEPGATVTVTVKAIGPPPKD